MTRPTRSPVNGPGPTPTRDRGEVLPDQPRRARARGSISGASCSPCLIVCSVVSSATTSVAVVQRDGDRRRGGVEGEQHGLRLASRGGSDLAESHPGQVRVDRRRGPAILLGRGSHQASPSTSLVGLERRRAPGSSARIDRRRSSIRRWCPYWIVATPDERDLAGVSSPCSARNSLDGGLPRPTRPSPIAAPAAAPTRRVRALWTSSTRPSCSATRIAMAQRDRAGRGRRGRPRRRAGSRRRSFSSGFSASGGRVAVGHLQLVPPRPDRRHQHPPRVEVGGSSGWASARMMRISSRDSARPSAIPSPHSTTVTASSSEVSRSRSSSSSMPPSR